MFEENREYNQFDMMSAGTLGVPNKKPGSVLRLPTLFPGTVHSDGPSVAMSTSGAEIIVLYAAVWPAAQARPHVHELVYCLCPPSSLSRTLVLLYRSIEHYLSCLIPINNAPSPSPLRSVVALSFASQLLL